MAATAIPDGVRIPGRSTSNSAKVASSRPGGTTRWFISDQPDPGEHPEAARSPDRLTSAGVGEARLIPVMIVLSRSPPIAAIPFKHETSHSVAQ